MSTVANIRNYTVQLLKNENVAKANIFNSKVSPQFLTNTPSVLVFTESVIASNQANLMPTFAPIIRLQIDIVVAMSNTWADDADAIVEKTVDTLMKDIAWRNMFDTIDSYQVDYAFINDMQTPLCTASLVITAKIFKAY